MRRILIPLHDTIQRASILSGIVNLFPPGSAELCLLGVVQRPDDYLTVDTYVGGMGFSTYRFSCTDEEWQTHCQRFAVELRRRAETLRRAGYWVHTQVQSGDPIDVIQTAAARDVYDLLALAHRPRTGLARWLLGNGYEQLLHQVALPVLLIAPDPVRQPVQALTLAKSEMLSYESALAHIF